MITRRSASKITWIAVQNPTQEDIEKVKEEFLLPFDVYDDLATPTLRPGAKIYEKCMYIVQHFPQMRDTDAANHAKKDKNSEVIRKHEIDFILGENWIISVSYTNVNNIVDLNKIFDDTTDQSTYHNIDVGRLYIQIIKSIYKKCDGKIDEIDSSLDLVEKNIYSGKERNMVSVLSQKMRDLIDLEHSFSMHENIILDAANFGQKLYGSNFTRGMNNLHSTYSEVTSRIKFLKDAFREFQNTNDSLLQHKTADAMKTLTMMSFVIFPLSLMAGIFGMNVQNMPIVGADYDFEIIILMMIVMSIIFFTYFKWKKWL